MQAGLKVNFGYGELNTSQNEALSLSQSQRSSLKAKALYLNATETTLSILRNGQQRRDTV